MSVAAALCRRVFCSGSRVGRKSGLTEQVNQLNYSRLNFW